MASLNIIKRVASKIDEETLSGFEKQISWDLPENYRHFLLSYNGGVPEDPVFSFGGEASDCNSMVRFFYGITEDSDKSLMYRWEIYTQARRVPFNTLPIACDPGGNLVLVSLGGSDKGSIYFWDHEQEGVYEHTSTRDCVSFLAKSFDEFVDGLEEENY